MRPRDSYWMGLALELASRGRGFVEPNPMVGCVIVENDELLSAGYHSFFGGPHAEVEALTKCDANRAATIDSGRRQRARVRRGGAVRRAMEDDGIATRIMPMTSM